MLIGWRLGPGGDVMTGTGRVVTLAPAGRAGGATGPRCDIEVRMGPGPSHRCGCESSDVSLQSRCAGSPYRRSRMPARNLRKAARSAGLDCAPAGGWDAKTRAVP